MFACCGENAIYYCGPLTHTRTHTSAAANNNNNNEQNEACGRDGTVRLWDCGSSQTITSWTLSERALNDICIVSAESGPSAEAKAPVEPGSAAEVGTAGKLVVAASEAGTVFGVDLRSRATAFSLLGDSATAVNCCCGVDGVGPTIACGREDGSVVEFDLRALEEPLATFQNDAGGSPITALAAVGGGGGGIRVGASDGTVTLWRRGGGEEGCCRTPVESYTGCYYSPITDIASSANSATLATASRDGVLRLYDFTR